ncbi:MAG: hypothetical protein V1494_01695 [Candidatus Diapherotrites archaeon]
MNKKAQISAEFFIVLFLLLLVFLSSIFVFSQQSVSVDASRKLMESNRIASKLARAIDGVASSDSNISVAISLEKPFDYNVFIEAHSVEVWVDDFFASAPISTSFVSLVSATPGASVKISNRDSNVVIQNA